MSQEVLGGLFSLAVAMVGCRLIISTRHLHGHFTKDARSGGQQKVSKTGAPRIGGVAIYSAVVVAAGTMNALHKLPAELILLLALAAVPAVMGGLLEDLTKKITVGVRLRFAFVSAAIAFFLVDGRVTQVDLPFFDAALMSVAVSFTFSVFAVGGMSHAMNIIDGFNGLFAVCALLMLAGIASIAYQVGDSAILTGAIIVSGAVLGFLFFNYPHGRIFAGDGGAYLVGFLIAEFAVLLVQRNSEISPWFALAVLVYPVFETIFSMYRKRVIRGRSVGQPDGAHLHMLVYRRLVRWYPGSKAVEHRLARNSLTSPYLWVLCAIGSAGAVAFWDRSLLLQAWVVVFSLLYIWFYRRIVRFSAPKLLIIRSAVAPGDWMEDTRSREA